MRNIDNDGKILFHDKDIQASALVTVTTIVLCKKAMLNHVHRRQRISMELYDRRVTGYTGSLYAWHKIFSLILREIHAAEIEIDLIPTDCPEGEVRSCYLQKPCIVVLFSQACFCPKIFSQIPSNLHLVSLLMTGRDPGSASCSSGAPVLTWCLTLTCQVSAPSSSPRLCSRHNSSLWPGAASLTSAASPLSRPQQSLALTEQAAS